MKARSGAVMGKASRCACVHKTFADYFTALAQAGFSTLPEVLELSVTDEHVAQDRPFFGPLFGHPLHVLFRLDAPP